MLAAGYLRGAIREAREQIGMSQAELARQIGISKNAMNDIETGDTDPRASRITAIALALDVSTDFLLGLDIGYRRAKRDKHVVEKCKAFAHIPASAPVTPPPTDKRPRTRKAASVG